MSETVWAIEIGPLTFEYDIHLSEIFVWRERDAWVTSIPDVTLPQWVWFTASALEKHHPENPKIV